MKLLKLECSEMLHGGISNCCLLSNTLCERDFANFGLQCSASNRRAFTAKKRRKSSFPPVFLKQKMPEKGGRREIVLAIESEVGSSLLFWSSHLEHKMYKKVIQSWIELRQRALLLTATKIRTKELEQGQELLQVTTFFLQQIETPS